MDTREEHHTIDITPEWRALIRPMAAVLANPDKDAAEARTNIITEMFRMADAADKWNARVAPALVRIDACLEELAEMREDEEPNTEGYLQAIRRDLTGTWPTEEETK